MTTRAELPEKIENAIDRLLDEDACDIEIEQRETELRAAIREDRERIEAAARLAGRLEQAKKTHVRGCACLEACSHLSAGRGYNHTAYTECVSEFTDPKCAEERDRLREAAGKEGECS